MWMVVVFFRYPDRVLFRLRWRIPLVGSAYLSLRDTWCERVFLRDAFISDTAQLSNR